MPEGDTIHKLARRMRPDLVGAPIAELAVRHRGSIESAVGRVIEAIDVRGKHMLVVAEGQLALHVHLGMNGRWRRYRGGERWDWRRSDAAAVIATADWEWGCFRPMRSEILEGAAIARHPALVNLGPDLLGDTVDWDRILAGAREPRNRRRPIAELLLDQRVASGIGNVYRSETLFTCRRSPWTAVSDLTDTELLSIYRTAAELMRDNLDRSWRRTTFEGRRRLPNREAMPSAWVYRRAKRPCLECGTTVEVRRHGDQARTTYFCPSCQASSP